jgi:hypothetical protein
MIDIQNYQMDTHILLLSIPPILSRRLQAPSHSDMSKASDVFVHVVRATP